MRPRAIESLQEELKMKMKDLESMATETQETVENPVPIQEDTEEKPVPIQEKSDADIEVILDGLTDEHLGFLTAKYTKNDKRWGRQKKINELLNTGITIEQIYDGRE